MALFPGWLFLAGTLFVLLNVSNCFQVIIILIAKIFVLGKCRRCLYYEVIWNGLKSRVPSSHSTKPLDLVDGEDGEALYFFSFLSLRPSSFDQVHQASVCITVRPGLQKKDCGGDQTQSPFWRGMASGKWMLSLVHKFEFLFFFYNIYLCQAEDKNMKQQAII